MEAPVSTLIERAGAGGVTTDLAIIGYEGLPPYLLALDLVMFLAKPTLICRDGAQIVAMRTDDTLYPKERPTALVAGVEIDRGRFWDRVNFGDRRFYVRRDYRDSLARLVEQRP
jgi:hypothetical protein